MIRISVTKNQFAKIGAQLEPRTNEVVVTTAFEISTEAKERSRVKTGTMKRGWYTRHISRTRSKVANPVPYAIFNEFGTAHMAAQPMIVPAVEHARPRFLARLRGIFDG